VPSGRTTFVRAAAGNLPEGINRLDNESCDRLVFLKLGRRSAKYRALMSGPHACLFFLADLFAAWKFATLAEGALLSILRLFYADRFGVAHTS